MTVRGRLESFALAWALRAGGRLAGPIVYTAVVCGALIDLAGVVFRGRRRHG